MSAKQTLNDFDSVSIDPSGRYKYVLIRLRQNGQERYLVRGFAWGEYHGNKKERSWNMFYQVSYLK